MDEDKLQALIEAAEEAEQDRDIQACDLDDEECLTCGS